MKEWQHRIAKVFLQGFSLTIFLRIMKPDLYDNWWMLALVWFSFSAYVTLDRWEWKKDD